MMFKKEIILGLILFFAFGCGNKGQKKEAQPFIAKDTVEEYLEYANVKLKEVEEQEINDYLNRYGWEMEETGTGLRYMIYESGTGKKAEKGMVATISFEASLINGIVVYSSKTDGNKSFMIGQSEAESGLHEGIQFMHLGDKAKLIIPSHLAFGLPGDQEKIPKRATIIYNLELLNLE